MKTIQEQERKHRQGYERYPITSDEFSAWEGEKAWGDDETRRHPPGHLLCS